MARLEAVKGDEGAPGVIFQRLSDGETLAKIAKSWQVPKGRFVEWFTTQHEALYDAALKVRAADLAFDAMDAALAATPEDVAVRKLQADVALKLAAKFDRARFGEMVRVEKSVTFGMDAGLLGTAGDLLRLAREKTVSGVEVLQAEPTPAPGLALRPPVVHEMI
jgi:hypothetical protein